jgi:hypothetical protein
MTAASATGGDAPSGTPPPPGPDRPHHPSSPLKDADGADSLTQPRDVAAHSPASVTRQPASQRITANTRGFTHRLSQHRIWRTTSAARSRQTPRAPPTAFADPTARQRHPPLRHPARLQLHRTTTQRQNDADRPAFGGPVGPSAESATGAGTPPSRACGRARLPVHRLTRRSHRSPGSNIVAGATRCRSVRVVPTVAASFCVSVRACKAWDFGDLVSDQIGARLPDGRSMQPVTSHDRNLTSGEGQYDDGSVTGQLLGGADGRAGRQDAGAAARSGGNPPRRVPHHGWRRRRLGFVVHGLAHRPLRAS